MSRYLYATERWPCVHTHLIFGREVERCHEYETQSKKNGTDDRDVDSEFGELIFNDADIGTA